MGRLNTPTSHRVMKVSSSTAPRCLALAVLCLAFSCHGVFANNPPIFLKDTNQLILSEGTPVGSVVYQLQGHDPEGLPVHYGIEGTDKLSVDRESGDVTLISALDRETNDTLRFYVTLEDDVEHGSNNVVRVPMTLVISDENDNPPKFRDTPYEISVAEDTPIGSTVFAGIHLTDDDLLGDSIEVMCQAPAQFPDACLKFELRPIEAGERSYSGALVLKEELDYSDRPNYQLVLNASDGTHFAVAGVEVKVVDVQNSPPVFLGSLTGVVKEDDPIGTLVMKVQARDGDRGKPRKVVYELLSNPLDYFLLDPETGELRTGKPLDKEALQDTTGVVNITVRAREVVDGAPGNDPLTVSTSTATVTVKDVNDEPPRFNQREFLVSLPENTPDGTPLPHLDMTVTDPDIGANSKFTLRLLDPTGAFAVEPTEVTGTTSVSIRVSNGSLDYEDPNQRKFILLVVAEDEGGAPGLSSTATVTVVTTDANDNVPTFEQDSYVSQVSETASPGAVVTTITARDRDSGRFGENGIVYQISGNGADNFAVNNLTGVITVAECPTPGFGNCLDYETKPVYFLSYKAIDDAGEGQSRSVPLKISLLDSNDNPPHFVTNEYRVVIDEGATNFDPPLQVIARDIDKTSEISYSITQGNVNDLFKIDPSTGVINVASSRGLDMTNVTSDEITLRVEASDGIFSSSCAVNITVRDVNNNHPVFQRESYLAAIQEDEPIGSSVETVRATDGDSGANAQVRYRVQKGAFEEFAVDEESGLVTITSKLDYDRRNSYNIEIIAIDGGSPPLSGTTTLTVSILNSNDKDPTFTPGTQRAFVSEDAALDVVFYTLVASDPDVDSTEALNFAAAEPITAIDKNGKQVADSEEFKSFFKVDKMTGEVSVARKLLRDIASEVRITVLVTDITAATTQQGRGTLVVTIIDVNDFAPTFSLPWTQNNPTMTLEIPEEQPIGTIVHKFEASDVDSNIASYEIEPESEFFSINNVTGLVRTKSRLDFETEPSLNFTVVAYDSGVPQKSAFVDVTVKVININDHDPVFSKDVYEATIAENSPSGTPVVQVTALDADADSLGSVSYSLIGEHSADFAVDRDTGEVTVANPGLLDREAMDEITIQVMASDGAPPDTRRTVAVPVHIKLTDVNDNAPTFAQRSYMVSVVENVATRPPAPIVQVRAEDPDITGALSYRILSGNDAGLFHLDEGTGIFYPATSLIGHASTVQLVVEATDGLHFDQCGVDVEILDVNQNKPVFVMPQNANATVEVPENAGLADYLVMTVKATDKDIGENGRVSYHLKVADDNVQETDSFFINSESGELRTKIILDREVKATYELILVAKDHGSPISYETLRFLTVLLVDTNDNSPEFSAPYFTFHVAENGAAPLAVGKLTAHDRDEGKHARVYYYITHGNEDSMFSIDKTDGTLYATQPFDREKRDEYNLKVKATNDPDLFGNRDKYRVDDGDSDMSAVNVQIFVLDENDNAPTFEHANYYTGINAMASINEFVVKLSAIDLDFGDNGTILYFLAASNLYKYGALRSTGSIVPSPFNVSQDGKLVTTNYMAEYNQDRFIVDVVAREIASPNREATARVHIWIYEPDQLIRVILSRPPDEVNAERNEIIAELSNVTAAIVVIDDIRFHVDADGQINHDWCDMYLHVVDKATQTISPVPSVLKVIDAKYDFLKDYYAGFAIENVMPAFVGVREESFDPALAALIALLIVMFVGVITFVVVCCCLRHWVMTTPSDLKKKEALIKKEILDDLNTTENPLWIEQKLKLYEEQELTMQVFSEPTNDSSPGFSQDNTYATIQPPSRRGTAPGSVGGGADNADYATLRSSTPMYETFHGSTFQVPQLPGGALSVNRDGQPEFIAELI